ncbi:uncharacterized protein LOC110689468 [Chenopodium quinoa]|uniref:uncharacterized protein LOC110689468 n=1 Tax=Chenopodium quinoa TaxID=63459 RepID=UPI000B791F2F|nr:uncharacterized protein LOC110689468 [Chenopodium quinoa]
MEGEVDTVLGVLSTYEVASGQKLNMDKSEVSFSRNIKQERKNMLQMKLSYKVVEGHDKYLGLPTYIGGSKKQLWSNKEWDLNILNANFSEIESWHFTKDGNYSVRSAYNLIADEQMRDMAVTSNSGSSFDWRVIWRAEIPQKIKLSAWRTIKDAVAAHSILARRGMEVDVLFPMCGECCESTLHLLVKCEEARWAFDRKRLDKNEVIRKAVCLVGEFEHAKEVCNSNSPSPILECVWKPPLAGLIKINFDAAIFSPSGVGLRGVMRDSVGDVVASTCCKVEGCFDVDVVEALAMRHSLNVAMESGFRHVCLETDCLKFHHHLMKGVTTSTAFGMIVNDILKLAQLCQSFSFSFVKRGGNKVAHALAKCSINFVGFIV